MSRIDDLQQTKPSKLVLLGQHCRPGIARGPTPRPLLPPRRCRGLPQLAVEGCASCCRPFLLNGGLVPHEAALCCDCAFVYVTRQVNEIGFPDLRTDNRGGIHHISRTGGLAGNASACAYEYDFVQEV